MATPLRILSLDGGGLKGIFAARFLANLEQRLGLRGQIHRYFDYIVGTSTGATIGLALATGIPAAEIERLYAVHGAKIFPTHLYAVPRSAIQFFWHPYRHEAFEKLLDEAFGDRTLGEVKTRVCVPACDGTLGETWIFKSPHHADFKGDWKRPIKQIARASSAAPTFLKPLHSHGYSFLDGGLYANNPSMVGIADALGCYDIAPRQIRLLSIGSGGKRASFGGLQKAFGGSLFWAQVIAHTMIDYSVQNARGQSQLIIGHENAIRVEPPSSAGAISMSDYVQVMAKLPGFADEAASRELDRLSDVFFQAETALPKFFYGPQARS